MRKLVVSLALMASGVMALRAQPAERPDRPFSLSLQGGPFLSVNENTFSYRENGKALDLITIQSSLTAGYDLSARFGLRLSASYGKNVSAANTRQTAAHGFYPYSFRSVNTFVDAIWNPSAKQSGFHPRFYGGLGGAYTFGFTDPGHPWQRISDRNVTFGFRVGVIGQYDLSPKISLYADLCSEAYTDWYNGLRPNEADQAAVEGYAGFPFDLRELLSFGIMFHF